MKWKCVRCGELVDEEFDVCWNCQAAKPASPTLVEEPPELAKDWADNFRAKEQPNGTVKIEAFGHRLTCGVCGSTTFRERTLTLMTLGTSNSATSYICSRCGYIFSFLPQ